MKLPQGNTERLEAVGNGLESCMKRLAQLEHYASVIPHKRKVISKVRPSGVRAA